MPAVVVTVSAAVTYGQTRFRAAAEPSIVLLAAVALVAMWDRVWAAPAQSSPASAAPDEASLR